MVSHTLIPSIQWKSTLVINIILLVGLLLLDTIGCLKNDYSTPTVNNIYSSSASTVSNLGNIQPCIEGRDCALQVQAASFYRVCLVWCTHVIGQNKLCCDWSE